MRSLSQQRSEFALSRLLDQSKNINKEYKNFVAGIPAMIIQNGFGQTMAFLLAKGESKHLLTFDMIKDWLVKNNLVQPENPNRTSLMLAISRMDQQTYLAVQEEALALLEWVKRYANALVNE